MKQSEVSDRGVVGGEAGMRKGPDLSLYKDFGFYSDSSGGDLLQAFGRGLP